MNTIIKSIIVGMFAIFPGISGSALAISLNIYDKFFLSLKDIKTNFKFLLQVIIGLIIGIIIGSNIIIYMIDLKNFLYYIFIGLIIGNIPSMIEKTNKLSYVSFFISFILSIITLLFCENIFNNDVNFYKMIIGGILFSFGKIFPGISSSFFLIALGIYDEIIVLFSNPLIFLSNALYFFPFIIGSLLGILIFTKLLNYLLLNKQDILYSALIGFVLSSIVSIFPKFNFNISNILGVVLMMAVSVISFKLNKKTRFNL